MVISVPLEYGHSNIEIKNVLYAPQMQSTLVSLGRLDDTGWSWKGVNGKLHIWNRSEKLVATIPKINGIYRIIHTPSSAYSAISMRKLTLYDLHCLLGHANYDYISTMIKYNLLQGISLLDDEQSMRRVECIC